MIAKTYSFGHLAKILGVSETTLSRWEANGKILKARRDHRGWRFYIESDFQKIFQSAGGRQFAPSFFSRIFNRLPLPYAIAGIGMLLLALNLFNLGQKVTYAYTNQTTTLFQTVNAGILDVVSASSSQAFAAVTVSFSAQSSSATLGGFRVEDARGSGAGWAVNLSGGDWKSGEEIEEMDYNGKGTDDDTGKLCLLVASGSILSNSGQSTSNITKGSLDCFSASTTSIDIYTAASSFGKGNYWIKEFTLEQYIPTSPTSGEYTTTIVLTIT